MGLFSGLLLGFTLGVALIAGWKYVMGNRSKKRISKTAGISLLGQLVQDDVKKLCNNNYPPWISFPAFERVKWINKMLDKIWPSVALAASQLIKQSIEPMLALYAPPGFNMSFSKLFLGNVAPQIAGIRIQTIQTGQLIMDLDFKWGGDPSIILAVRTLVGAILPVQLKNLRFFSTVRVIFKLSDEIPCISAVVVALLAKPKPEIRYTLKLIGGSLSSVPGISEMIKGIVENAVTDSLEWPHRIVIPISETPVDVSDLILKLQGQLTVTIVKAESLKNMETFSKSDPYVEAYVRVLFRNRTKTIDNNLNPVWNETFTFDIEDQETQSLVLKVFDEDIGADKLLGVVTHPLAKIIPEETKELTLALTPYVEMDNVIDKRDRGTITVKIHYHPYSKDEQEAAMKNEQDQLEARKQEAQGIIGGTIDAIGGAGKLVIGGVGMVGSGVGRMGSGISRAGKMAIKGVSSSFSSRKSLRTIDQENGEPETPK